jgi:hypothetical protein
MAAAQCNEPMDAATTNALTGGAALGNAFGCPGGDNTNSDPCGLKYRYYSPDPASNGSVNKAADGNPIYIATKANGAFRSDVDNSQNYYGSAHPCGLPMYVLWDGELDSTSGDHVGYYGAQGQLIYQAELGNIYQACGGTARSISCFAALGGAETANVPNTPMGTLLPTGGMSPIPVAIVESYDRTSGDIDLSWVAPGNFHPTGEGETNPILGVELHILESTGVLDRSAVTATDAESGAVFKQRIDLPATGTTLNDVADLTPGTGSFIPFLKVIYSPNAGGVDPMRTTFFSANGAVVLIDTSLFTEVTNFQASFAGKTRGYFSFNVTWDTTVEDGLEGFILKRATSLQGPFVAVTDLITPQGYGGEGASYEVTDTFRPRGKTAFFYLLEIHENDAATRDHGPIRAVAPSPSGHQKLQSREQVVVD